MIYSINVISLPAATALFQIVLLLLAHHLGRTWSSTELCQGITCKAKPSEGVCVPRNATTLSATSVYGAQRICCSAFACTHPNGTTTVHYGLSGMKKANKSGRSMGAGGGGKPKNLNESCQGIVCMGGQPSSNCRRHSPPAILSLMRVESNCCEMWTCTFGSNGSMFYVHSGMLQKGTYWKVTEEGAVLDGDVGKAVVEPPPSTNPPISKKAPTRKPKRDELDVEMDDKWGDQVVGMEKVGGACDGVSCLPSQKQLKCSSLAGEQVKGETLKLLALVGGSPPCCPLHICSGKSKAYLMHFGMFYAEPKNNNTPTEDPKASMLPVEATTPMPARVTTESFKAVATTQRAQAPIITPKPQPQPHPSSPLPPAAMASLSNPKPMVLSTPKPVAPATTHKPSLSSPRPASANTTTHKPTPQPQPHRSTTSTTSKPAPAATPHEVLVMDTPPPSWVEQSIRNSTVNKPECRNMRCFPSPDPDKCFESKVTDCELVLLFGSALDCCPAYKCPPDAEHGGSDGAPSSYTLQFGISDGVSETVVSNEAPPSAPPKCEDGQKPAANASRPVLLFDVLIQHTALSKKAVRYVSSCAPFLPLCIPPRLSAHAKKCERLGKGTVPKELLEKGVRDTCCSVWKCSGNAMHYGYLRSPYVHVAFEHPGGPAALPQYLALKEAEPEPLKESDKCPGVLCSPPLQSAECKVGDEAAIKAVEGSLRYKKKCCPIWICKRKDGTDMVMYGRTSPDKYKGIKSILNVNLTNSKQQQQQQHGKADASSGAADGQVVVLSSISKMSLPQSQVFAQLEQPPSMMLSLQQENARMMAINQAQINSMMMGMQQQHSMAPMGTIPSMSMGPMGMQQQMVVGGMKMNQQMSMDDGMMGAMGGGFGGMGMQQQMGMFG